MTDKPKKIRGELISECSLQGWKCDVCGRVYADIMTAGLCCMTHRICKQCGEEYEDNHRLMCDRCLHVKRQNEVRERLDKAIEIEHPTDDTMLYHDESDTYFDSTDDYLESIYCENEDADEWLFATKPVSMVIDADEVIDRVIENLYDCSEVDPPLNIGMIGYDEFKAACKKFSADNAKLTRLYYPDYTRKVRVQNDR